MFKVIANTEQGNSAQFIIEPLEAGFGHTLGNSLRRVLLTSLEGSAITSMKIEGVAHQFSTIEGISEDVIEIILNLKKIRVKVFDKPVKLVFRVSGKKVVKAKDLEVVGDGEVVSGDVHIATLSSPQAKLNIELTALRGKGYSPAEERKSSEIGAIPIDALFSPVIDVNYKVEPTRVGRRADYDKLTLDVTTDGTITPLEVLNEASKILSQTFRHIYEPVVEDAEEPVSESVPDEVLKLTVEELDLPVRITNALRAVDINTVEDLINVQRGQLLRAKNLGSKSLALISAKLSERGLSLREA